MDSVRMWDPITMRFLMMWDVMWLKRLRFQPVDVAAVMELEKAEDQDNDESAP